MKNQILKELSVSELNARAELLKELCLNLDPYTPLSDEDKTTLNDLGFEELDDPFRLTNALILSMEDTLEEIQKREDPSSGPTLH